MMLTNVKKRRKRKRGYHKGSYVSTKTGIACKYRSGWEYAYMQHLDNSANVMSWNYEALRIQYVSNKSTGRLRTYIPDFFVTYTDGSCCVVEIKQHRKLINAVVVKKVAAAKEWCAQNNCVFVILTEVELRNMKLI